MDLNFLGCGSAFNPLYGNTRAFFTNKDQLYVIDGGESVFLKLYQKELLKKYAGITIMVTHMHADHVGSLPSIISYCYYVLGKKVTVIYPEKSLWILLGLMGIDPDIYIPVESSLFTAEGLKVWAVSVKHADDISCFGYIIEFAGEKIYYSGDSYEIPKDVLDGFYKREISTIYQDTTEFTSDHRSHCPLEELEECIPADLRRNVFCMHFTTDFTEKLKKKGTWELLASTTSQNETELDVKDLNQYNSVILICYNSYNNLVASTEISVDLLKKQGENSFFVNYNNTAPYVAYCYYKSDTSVVMRCVNNSTTKAELYGIY